MCQWLIAIGEPLKVPTPAELIPVSDTIPLSIGHGNWKTCGTLVWYQNKTRTKDTVPVPNFIDATRKDFQQRLRVSRCGLASAILRA
jgi:hypothetical protein